jgi:tetratricopeptide (TPR) repeat protein
MSRSIHATLRDPRDPGDLGTKRLIKELVAEERVRLAQLAPAEAPSTVPIQVCDRGPYIHYPASEHDLRGLLALMPRGVVDGVKAIELRLGSDEDARDVDPFVGRLSNEIGPGVYCGRILGRYQIDGPTIEIFGYVYNASNAVLPVVETWLRLRMLTTFVHELGHHEDASMRVARGRWRFDDRVDQEIYAEAIEYAWTREYVVPYLEETYPAEVDALRGWLVEHGGIALPLEAIAGDPRSTDLSERYSFFSVEAAFKRLLRCVAEETPAKETRIAFANELHYAEAYEEALAVLAGVLDAHADDAAALTLRADIFVHQERFDEADAIARVVVEGDESALDAWRVLADVAQARGDWRALLETASRGLAVQTKMPWMTRSLRVLATRARIELGDIDGVDRDLAALAESAMPSHARQMLQLRSLALHRRGRFAEALALASEEAAKHYRPADLVAVRFEASVRLGRPSTPLDDETVAGLRRMGYAAWASALVDLSAR